MTVHRDASGRVVKRVTDPAGAPPAAEVATLYAGDAAWGQTDGTTLTRFVSLPGGVTLTRTDAEITVSVPNLQGHQLITATTTTTGTAVGELGVFDPYGQPLDPETLAIGTPAANQTGQLADGVTGWHQGATKQIETLGSVIIAEMGARLYVPALGRFLQVDPVEGGVDNDYVWPTDPVGKHDLSGNFAIPLIPVLAVIAVLLIVVAYVVAKQRVTLPPIRLSMPSLSQKDSTPSRTNSRSVVIPKPQFTTWRSRVPYKVYEIKSTVTNETWKYGITSGAPFEARPRDQYGDCSRYFGQPCTHQFKANATGYYNARTIEYGYILNYVAVVGNCPPGQLEYCK